MMDKIMNYEPGATTLQEAVFQALGAASVCWDDMSGTGVFQSDRAKQIGDELMVFIMHHVVAQDAPTDICGTGQFPCAHRAHDITCNHPVKA